MPQDRREKGGRMRSWGRRGNRQVILEGDARKFVLAAARAGAVIVVVKTQVGDKWGIRSELKALLSGRNWLFSHSDSFFYIPLFFPPFSLSPRLVRVDVVKTSWED